MSDLQRLDEALAQRDMAKRGAMLTPIAQDLRRVLAGETHDKGRSCERTEEVLDNYRQRAIKAERVLAEGREIEVMPGNPRARTNERRNWLNPETDVIELEDYDGYGCEGAGHYLAVDLPPGRYVIVPLIVDRSEP